MAAASTSSSSAMSKKRTSTAVRLAAAAIALSAANAAVYDVSPDGEPMTLTAALDVAGPGDTISLADGIYLEPIVTTQGGEEGNPLTIEGGRGAVINYFSGDKSIMWSQKVVDIKHSWITLRGFTVDGQLVDKGGDEEEDDFVDKCIWVESLEPATMVTYAGKEVETALIGTVIEDMRIQNCGMECIRMRNFVTNSVIQNNEISDCGIYDFRFQFDSVIGEAIYIGTSSNQWCSDRVQEVRDICTGPDACNYNLVRGNTLTPRGNECVDIKEGASYNVVEDNDCSDQRDAESGCYDSRGNDNTFRNNRADMCEGAAIRLGGHEVDGVVYGTYNHVYHNVFNGAEYGSIKSMQDPQGTICGNSCDSGECGINEQGDGEIEESWDQECTGDMPYVPFIDDGDLPTNGATEVPSPTPETVDSTLQPVAAPTSSGPVGELPEYEALGCFTDKNSARIMQHKLHDTDLTTESCALECEGYAFFGTQYGVECWCGDDSTDYLQHGESEACDYGCAGDDSQTCGGKWAMTVYKYEGSVE